MSDLTELQKHLNLLNKQVKLKEQTERLLDNEDFKAVVINGFCSDEVKRNLGMAVCSTAPKELRDLCDQLAKAGAALQNYLNTNIRLGINAEEDIKEVESQIEELRMKGEE